MRPAPHTGKLKGLADRSDEIDAKKIDDGGFATPHRLRKQVVEPVFGQIKKIRGFCQLLLRGVRKYVPVGHESPTDNLAKTFHPVAWVLDH